MKEAAIDVMYFLACYGLATLWRDLGLPFVGWTWNKPAGSGLRFRIVRKEPV